MRCGRRTLSVVAAVAAMVSVVSLPAVIAGQPVVAAQAVSVALISQSTWIDSIGAAHCVGEVKNTGSTTAQFVQISVNEESASNTILATDFTFALVDPLTPGTKSGYSDDIFSPPAGFTHCVVSDVSDESGGSPNYNFATAVTNVFSDSSGKHYVGTVTNQNLTTADFVRVNFTFYDGAGVANDADFTFVQSGSTASLAPGQTASFEEIQLSGSPAETSYAALTTSSTPPALPRPFSAHGVGAPQVAVTPDGSTQLVFWKSTTNNQLAEAWYTGKWNGPVGFPQLGTLTSTPAVAVTKDGSTQLVFWQGPGGHLFEAWYTGVWNGPLDITSTYLGGHAILGSAPSVVTTKDGSQLVFWRGTDGHLGEAWFSGTWHGPVDFSNLGAMASAPSATITADGSTQLVFFQAANNRLTEDWFTGVWNGPMTLGSLTSQPSVAVTPDGSTQLVFYKSAAGHLLESWYTGTWNGPVDFTSTAFGGNGLLTSSPSATVTVDGSTQLVFWQGAGSTLWEGWYAGGGWHGPVDWSPG